MGEKELREKYGGKLAKAINRAIRAEIAGGNDALEKLTALAGAARHSQWKDTSGNDTPEATAYFRHKRNVVDRMDNEVRLKWGVPLEIRGADRPRTTDPRKPNRPRRPGTKPAARAPFPRKPGTKRPPRKAAKT